MKKETCKDEVNAPLARLLREARQAQGMSQVDLCNALNFGCSCETIDGYESGRIPVPAGFIEPALRQLGVILSTNPKKN